MLRVTDLTVQYGQKVIVDHVSFTAHPGEWLMIVGPNGAGKSTVVAAIAQDIRYGGRIELEGRDLKQMSHDQRAKRLGVLTQTHGVGYAFTVEEIVRLGRYARTSSPWKNREGGGEEALERALSLTGLLEQRRQSVLTLSGGELQRAFLAQLICQDPAWMILDEPTNHLDPVHVKLVFSLLDNWRKEAGRGIISVVHDIGLAKAFGTHALLMERGKVAALGKTEDVLTEEHLNKVYQMDLMEWIRKTAGFLQP